MIISVHLPKTAGKSFQAALEARFGTSLLEDYASFPMNTPEVERTRSALEASLQNADREFAGVQCIHGHFLPVKYLLMATRRPLTFVTWLRDPVDRVLSNYYYWKRAYEPESSPPLHRKVVEEDWSVERFCLCSEMRNMYAQFLWGFPVENFDFIGVTEHYDEDLAYFADRFLGVPVEAQRLNVGAAQGGPYQIDEGLRQRIEAFHDRDMDLYRRALEKRRARLASGTRRVVQ
jgi:hypothetical protein